jgi:preprotein translocase subunit SecG
MKLVILLLHIAVCVALILIVLIQKGKGAGMGVAFGGTSQTVFGSGGATSFLHKVTTIVAIVFMLTSLSLSFFYGKRTTSSIMEGVKQTQVPTTENTNKPAQTGGAQGQQ